MGRGALSQAGWRLRGFRGLGTVGNHGAGDRQELALPRVSGARGITTWVPWDKSPFANPALGMWGSTCAELCPFSALG